MSDDDLRQKNNKVLLIVTAFVVGMIVLAFASVPLYRRFCQATGWGGTTQTVAANNSKIYNREFTIQFNADTDPTLPWTFKPDQWSVKVKVGQNAIVSYSAVNNSKETITGTAIHNVTPSKAGQYFNKTQCFCFGQQVLKPGEKEHLPVTFFIDPKIMDDRELTNLKTITLSYTFYRQASPELEKAQKKLYDTP